MKIKTSELTGRILDYVVAMIEDESLMQSDIIVEYPYLYSSEWALGGPIIEREGITIRTLWTAGKRNKGNDSYRADIDFVNGNMTLGNFSEYGETILIAAMRCYVACKFGDEVEIPTAYLS